MKHRVLVDSSIWIDLFTKGPKYSACKNLIENSIIVGVPTIVIYEVCRKISIKVSSDSAMTVAAYLRQFSILNLTDEIALFAIDLSIEHKLAMAASMVLAHANVAESMLVTLDNDLRSIRGAKVL